MTVDYAMVIGEVNKQIRSVTNQMPLLEQQSIKEVPDYPYGSYSVLNPYLNVKTYREDQDKMIQSIEITLSYTFYGRSSFEIIALAQKTLTNFEHRATKQVLWDNGIAVIDMANLQNRDTFLTVDIERRVGFDIRLRVNSISSKVLSDIITVELEDGSEIEK